MKFRPCIDLHNGKVKQIVGETLSDSNRGLVENFVSDKDAAYYAALFQRDNVYGGHVIMLGNGNTQQAKLALQTFPGGLQVGGGIVPENAGEFLDAGASHVIVTSYVFQNGTIHMERLQEMVSKVGKEQLVLDLSCKKRENKADGTYYVVTDRWQTYTDYAINAENLEMLSQYCTEFLVHAASVEGKRSGVDIDLIEQLCAYSPIPVTYAGGVGTMEDIAVIQKHGQGRLDYTVGSALDLFGGNLEYETLVHL